MAVLHRNLAVILGLEEASYFGRIGVLRGSAMVVGYGVDKFLSTSCQ